MNTIACMRLVYQVRLAFKYTAIVYLHIHRHMTTADLFIPTDGK